MDPILEITSVFQHVGGRCALYDISLRVVRGDWLLLIGPNGAGKSLLARLILRLDIPSAGTIKLFGEDLEHLNDRAMTGITARDWARCFKAAPCSRA